MSDFILRRCLKIVIVIMDLFIQQIFIEYLQVSSTNDSRWELGVNKTSKFSAIGEPTRNTREVQRGNIIIYGCGASMDRLTKMKSSIGTYIKFNICETLF